MIFQHKLIGIKTDAVIAPAHIAIQKTLAVVVCQPWGVLYVYFLLWGHTSVGLESIRMVALWPDSGLGARIFTKSVNDFIS